MNLLESLGAKYVFNSSKDSFNSSLEQAINELTPKVYFTCLGGGEIVQKVFESMPNNSQVYVMGGLAGEPFSFLPSI